MARRRSPQCTTTFGAATVDGLRQRTAVDDVERGVEQQQEAGATGVDDAGLLQHGQEVGRALERRRRAGLGGLEHVERASRRSTAAAAASRPRARR